MDGMHTYERGREAVIYATFVKTNGEAATIVGTPTISLYHYKAGTYITDVNAQNMTLMVDSTYYYKHSFPPNADLGMYTAKFFATYSTGQNVVGEQDVRLVDRDFYKDVGRAVGGIVRPAGKDVWSSKEKTGLLVSIQDLKKLIEEIQRLTASIKMPSYKPLETKLEELEANVSNSIVKNKVQLPPDKSNTILAELAELRVKIEEANKLSHDVVLLKESNEALMELVLRRLPATELETVLSEVDDEKAQGISSAGVEKTPG